MPKLGAEPLRRAETINATLECIYEHGLEKITLDLVAAKAGFSKGIVSYYFKSKKNLILESLKQFLAAYSLKIGSAIRKGMDPMDMLRTVVEVALPPRSDTRTDTINVSTLEGAGQIRLPQERIAKIFIQFISMAAVDNELKQIMQDTYEKDVEGIAQLIGYAKGGNATDQEGRELRQAAYALFAMIYGLSLFRINDFMPAGEADNRHIAFDLIHTLTSQKEKP